MEQCTKAVGQERLWTRDFVTITLITLCTFLGFQMLMPTLPLYAVKLGGSETFAGLVVGLFTLSAVLIRPFAGYALDAYGRKGLFRLGLVVFALCVFAYAWVPSLLLLLAVRFFHGFGWGLSSTSSSTIAADLIPKSRMGEGMGYYGLAGTLSMALAPAFGLYLVNRYDYTVLFLLSTCLVLVSIALAFSLNYKQVGGQKPKFNLVEKTALRPTLVVFLVSTTFGAVIPFLAIYAGQKGIENIGPFFTLYAVSLALVRPTGGRLADRYGFDLVVVPGLLLLILAMFLLHRAESLFSFLVAAVVYGAGFGAVQPSLQALAVLGAPPERRGSANATFFSGFDLGIGLSAMLWGAVAQVTGYSQMYLWAGVPAAVAVAVYRLAARPLQGS